MEGPHIAVNPVNFVTSLSSAALKPISLKERADGEHVTPWNVQRVPSEGGHFPSQSSP